jgi:hypothetical protein
MRLCFIISSKSLWALSVGYSTTFREAEIIQAATWRP